MENLAHYAKEERPWGNFERFTLNEKTTIKIISVNAGESFSARSTALPADRRDSYALK